jgi:hypothetical protein
MRKFVLLAALAAGSAALPGCLLVAGAAIGAGVVYAAGDDTAEVRVHATADSAYTAAREEVLLRGVVDSSDPDAGVLEGKIGTSHVRVRVVTEPDGLVKVTVRARTSSGIGPDMDTANDVAVAIVRRVG